MFTRNTMQKILEWVSPNQPKPFYWAHPLKKGVQTEMVYGTEKKGKLKQFSRSFRKSTAGQLPAQWVTKFELKIFLKKEMDFP